MNHSSVTPPQSWLAGVVVLGLSVPCTLFSQRALARLVLPHLRSWSRRVRAGWLLLVLVVAVLVLVVAGDSVPGGMTSHQLEIEAHGLRHPAAQGGEVWVLGLQHNDRAASPFSAFLPSTGWALRDDALFAAGGAAPLRWRGETDGDLRLVLRMHPWSGRAQVRWDGTVQLVDLYAPDFRTQTLVLPNRRIITVREHWTPGSALRFAADLLSLAWALLLVGIWVARVLRPIADAPAASQPRWFRLLTSQRRIRWLLLALLALLAATVTPAVVRLCFGDALDSSTPLASSYLLAWGYAALTFGAGWYLLVYRPAARATPATQPARLRWLARVIGGQTLAAWLVALIIVLGAAYAVVQLLGLGGQQRAFWVKLALDTSDGAPPVAQIRYGPSPADVVALDLWQPYASTDVALRPAQGTALPVRVLAAATEGGALPLEQITAANAQRDPTSISVADPQGALLSWLQSSRAFTLTLAPGSGSVEVLRLDQRVTVELGPAPVQVSLRLPAAQQGWALLPPQPITQLAVEFPNGTAPALLREVELLRDQPQRWTVQGQPWAAAGCAVQTADAALRVAAQPATRCTVSLPDVQPFNLRSPAVLVRAWVAVTLIILLALWLLAQAAQSERQRADRLQQQNRRTPDWQVGWSQRGRLTGGAAATFGLALLVQSVYALTLRPLYAVDSVLYFDASLMFAPTHRFAAMLTERTPGYPLLISAVFAWWGVTLVGVLVVQHLLLALLAPLAVAALARRVPLSVALLAGVLVALMPITSLYANNIGTEPLFTLCATAALLVFVGWGETPRGMVAVGLLVGLTVMMRPNGVLLLAVLLGWVLLEGWCRISTPGLQRAALARGTALLVGYCVVAAPWQMHLKVVRHTYDLSQNLASFGGWAAGVYQRRIDGDLPINRPDRALWTAAYAWGHDPFGFAARRPTAFVWSALVPYYTAANQEELYFYPDRWRNNFERALRYNLMLADPPAPARCLLRGEPDTLYQSGLEACTRGVRAAGTPPYVYWNEVSAVAFAMQDSAPLPPLLPGSPTDAVMNKLANSWQPGLSPLGGWALALSVFALTHWHWLALPALFSVVVLLLRAKLRALVPAWLFWMALLGSTSVLGMPVERYIVVVEPLLAVLVVVAGYGLVQLVYRRRARAPAP